MFGSTPRRLNTFALHEKILHGKPSLSMQNRNEMGRRADSLPLLYLMTEECRILGYGRWVVGLRPPISSKRHIMGRGYLGS